MEQDNVTPPKSNLEKAILKDLDLMMALILTEEMEEPVEPAIGFIAQTHNVSPLFVMELFQELATQYPDLFTLTIN